MKDITQQEQLDGYSQTFVELVFSLVVLDILRNIMLRLLMVNFLMALGPMVNVFLDGLPQ